MTLHSLIMKLVVLSIIFWNLGIKNFATSSSAAEGPTVCVIGCGPGGMFFLHAISERRRMMEATGDNEGLRRLPASVTVFEKSSAPGGVWKAERNFETDHDHDAVQCRETCPQNSSLKTPNPDSCDVAFPSTNESNEVSGNMYEALWTNGLKERIEFVDYTFQDHFGKDVPVPTYLPRQVILEYITSRVTRNNPDLFDDVRYNTEVISVVYDEERAKFLVTAKSHDNQMIQTSEFDKCVWAAGNEGKTYIPEDVDLVLKNGGYLGDIIHSSEVGRIDFDSAVRGKKVLMVGDSFSAEDLTLVAIKADAAKVYILSRLGKGIVNLSSSWPGNKVELLRGFMLTGVTKNGLGLRFKESRYIHGSDHDKHYVVQDGKTIEEDISLVVYCTGYDQNLNMLQDSLRPPSADDGFGDIPEGWMMKHNYLSDDLGVIPLSHHIKFYGTIPGIYRGLLISNPSIMFFVEQFEAPLFEIDVQAWLFVAYIIGSTEIPSNDEMKKHNSKQTINELNVPETRKVMDSNYFLAWENLGHNHWSKNFTNPRALIILEEYFTFYLRIMAQKMKDAQYPDNIGSLEKLNDKGEAIVKLDLESVLHRTSIPTDGPQVEWKTFRDADPSGIKSIHTGAEAAQLNSRWLDLENSAYDDLLQK